MTLHSGPFNGLDRAWRAEDFARYHAFFIGNGVFPNPSTGLQVIQGENMQTIIRPGVCWINGYYLWNTDDYVIQHENADGVLKRIDRIVVRWDISLRDVILVVKKGAFSSSPVPPAVQRDTTVYELALADVLIMNGAIQITQANITDTRLNSEVCGIVHGLVDQVDTTTIFNQYQSWYEQMTGEKLDEYNAWFAKHQQEFMDWFASIRDILDGDVAGNLLILIQQNQSDIRSMIKHKTNVTVLASGWALNGERYEYVISDVNISASSIVDVNIHIDSLDNARMLLSACNSSNGAVTLYASSIPDADLIVDYRITNEVI